LKGRKKSEGNGEEKLATREKSEELAFVGKSKDLETVPRAEAFCQNANTVYL